jgi:hypothetical protein
MRQYGDTLCEEKAQAELQQGIRMEKGDVDTYVAKFEKLVCNAGYDIDQPLVLDLFAQGLPLKLQKLSYMHDQHMNYEEWKEATITHQGQYMHIKNKFEQCRHLIHLVPQQPTWTILEPYPSDGYIC